MAETSRTTDRPPPARRPERRLPEVETPTLPLSEREAERRLPLPGVPLDTVGPMGGNGQSLQQLQRAAGNQAMSRLLAPSSTDLASISTVDEATVETARAPAATEVIAPEAEQVTTQAPQSRREPDEAPAATEVIAPGAEQVTTQALQSSRDEDEVPADPDTRAAERPLASPSARTGDEEVAAGETTVGTEGAPTPEPEEPETAPQETGPTEAETGEQATEEPAEAEAAAEATPEAEEESEEEAAGEASAEAGVGRSEAAGVQGQEGAGEMAAGPATGEAAVEEIVLAPMPPIMLQAVAPLPQPAIELSFDAARALPATQLRADLGLERVDPWRAQAAVERVARRFAAQRDEIQKKHDQIAAEGMRAISDITWLFEQVQSEIPLLLSDADAAVEAAYQATLERVETEAADALTRIDESYEAARLQVIAAAAAGRSAVRRNSETSQAQIEAIVGSLTQSRLQFITDVDFDTAQYAFNAVERVNSWRDNIATIYPDEGTGYVPAKHESYRAAAPGIAERAGQGIIAQGQSISFSLAEVSQQVQTNIQEAVVPTLQNHAARIRSEGMSSVRRAFRSALRGIEQQADAARATVTDTTQSARLQLFSRRRMARAQLEQEAQQALNVAQSQSSTAIDTISVSLEQTLPHYAGAVEQLQLSLQEAAGGGLESLELVAEDAIPNVATSVTEAFDIQQEQQATIMSGVQSGMAEQRVSFGTTIDDVRTEGIDALNEAAQLTSEGIQNTAASISDGFSTAADGINQVSAYWASPLAQVFDQLITSVQNQLAASEPQFVSDLEQHTRPFREWALRYEDAESVMAETLPPTFVPTRENLKQRARDLDRGLDSWSLFDWTDEAAITRPLHGLTRARGIGLKQMWRDTQGGQDLLEALADELGDDSDDYYAARAWLRGDPTAAARYELRASLGFFNDDEARIEATMRALSPDQIRAIPDLDRALGTDVLGDVRDALGGTDLAVFNALAEANYALADAHRMREEVDRARMQDDEDAVAAILTEYSTGRRVDPYAYVPEDYSAEAHWRSVVGEFAGLRGVREASTEEASETQAVIDYILRDIEVTRSAGEGGTYTETLRVEGRHRDLVSAIVTHGGESIDARVARLGVETERRGGPNILNLDTALVDERFHPDYGGPDISPEDLQEAREAARRDRDEVLRRYALEYGGSEGEVELNTARTNLIRELRARADDPTEADLAAALVEEEYPSPATAAIAMEYATEGAGTREEVIWRFTERMNRDQITEMRRLYDEDGRDLYAELGVFGQGGWFTELSGDERMRAERAMLGRPRDDRERAEVAAFTIHQQRVETGLIGSWWAEGSYSERALAYEERRLRELIGTEITFGPEGLPTPRDPVAFANSFDERTGRFKGDQAEFAATILGARLASENYAAKVDQLAQAVTTIIAIAGAIVAGVVTVATGGAASPLLLAAIAGVTGATAMGAQALIRGGRYGWEQAAVDLGMTAVDALTAGIGQGLSVASRGGTAGLRASLGLAREAGEEGVGLVAQMSIRNARQLAVQNIDDTTRLLGNMGRLTGSAFGDQLLIGAGTGTLGSLGRTALDESTYAKGGARAVDNLFASIFRGMTSGIVTAGLTNSFDRIAPTLGSSTSIWRRGLYQAGTNALGGFGGRYVELGIDAARGEYRGDAGDIFEASLQAAAQSFLQSGAEGGLSALAQRGYNRFARPYDERLQANQLRARMDSALGNPEAMQQLLGEIAKAPPGVRAFLFDPTGAILSLPAVVEAGPPGMHSRPSGEPIAGEGSEVRLAPPAGEKPETVPRPVDAGEALPRPGDLLDAADFRVAGAAEPPDVTRPASDVEGAAAGRAVDQLESGAGTEPPARAPAERVMVPDAEGNPVPAAELLPTDLRNHTPIVRDPSLTGTAVEVHRSPRIHIRIGPEATAGDILLHTGTARDMHRARGLIGLVRRARDAIVGSPRPDTIAGEAYQELDKLPAIIEDRMARMGRTTDPAEMRRLQGELANLYGQYRRHAEAAMSGEEAPGRGFVAMEDTTAQLQRLYGEGAEGTTRQIETDLARLFPDADTQARVLDRLVANATSTDDARTTLYKHLHDLALLSTRPAGQEADFRQLAARVAEGLSSSDVDTFEGANYLLARISEGPGTGPAKANRILGRVDLEQIQAIRNHHPDAADKDVFSALDYIASRARPGTDIPELIRRAGVDAFARDDSFARSDPDLFRLAETIEKMRKGATFSAQEIEAAIRRQNQIARELAEMGDELERGIFRALGDVEVDDENQRQLRRIFTGEEGEYSSSKAFDYFFDNDRVRGIVDNLIGQDPEVNLARWLKVEAAIRNTDLPTIVQNDIIGKYWERINYQRLENLNRDAHSQVRVIINKPPDAGEAEGPARGGGQRSELPPDSWPDAVIVDRVVEARTESGAPVRRVYLSIEEYKTGGAGLSDPQKLLLAAINTDGPNPHLEFNLPPALVLPPQGGLVEIYITGFAVVRPGHPPEQLLP